MKNTKLSQRTLKKFGDRNFTCQGVQDQSWNIFFTSFAISGDVMTTCLIEPTWIENMGPYFAAQVVKLLCNFFSFSNCNKLPNNGSLGMVIIKIQTHCKNRFFYIQFKKNPRIDIHILRTKLCHLVNIPLHPSSNYCEL